MALASSYEPLVRLEQSVRAKIRTLQGGVLTFFDVLLLNTLDNIRLRVAAVMNGTAAPEDESDSFSGLIEAVRRYSRLREQPRYASYEQRAQETAHWAPLPWEVTPIQIKALQGVDHCLQWRGMPLFKTALEMALYPMLLWDLRPSNIIEIGSGAGASAIWLADLLRIFEIDCAVYSLDRVKPQISHPGVTFIEGDCNAIENALTPHLLISLPHPWLVIEDAHVNLAGVLSYLGAFMHAGDYLIVEDCLSKTKSRALASFMQGQTSAFAVDSHYTDFFGRNASSSRDSIFRRL